jgi:hypothetical protein
MMQLMHGFAPSADTQVTLANWRQAPFSRWAFHHERELVPSAEIANNPADVHEWPIDHVELGDIPIAGGGARPLSFDEFLPTPVPTASSSLEAVGSSSSDTPMV